MLSRPRTSPLERARSARCMSSHSRRMSQWSEPCSRTGSFAKRQTSARSRTPDRSRPEHRPPAFRTEVERQEVASIGTAYEHTRGTAAGQPFRGRRAVLHHGTRRVVRLRTRRWQETVAVRIASGRGDRGIVDRVQNDVAARMVPSCRAHDARSIVTAHDRSTAIQDAIRRGRQDFCGSSPAGFPARSCTRDGGSGCTPTTSTRSARTAAGINERWFSSTTNADNGPGTPADEGLSYVRLNGGQRFLLKDAVEQAGDLLLGAPVMAREKGWNLLCKFFDNMGPIPHHMHQSDEHAARVGRRGKPEAYYFPPQYNPTDNNYPYTFMGLEPGTTKDDVRRCLENWNKGDNGIMYLSRAYRLRARQRLADRSGHPARARLAPDLRAAGEQRRVRDVPVRGRRTDHAVGVCSSRTCRRSSTHDLDYIIGMLDWDANVNPRFGEATATSRSRSKPFARDRTRRLSRAVGHLRHRAGTPPRS